MASPVTFKPAGIALLVLAAIIVGLGVASGRRPLAIIGIVVAFFGLVMLARAKGRR
jgi:uncharacterized membrane protein